MKLIGSKEEKKYYYGFSMYFFFCFFLKKKKKIIFDDEQNLHCLCIGIVTKMSNSVELQLYFILYSPLHPKMFYTHFIHTKQISKKKVQSIYIGFLECTNAIFYECVTLYGSLYYWYVRCWRCLFWAEREHTKKYTSFLVFLFNTH